MNAINWVEWVGYAASVIVAVSLMMNSIVKLRWYNLIGASIFSVYGFIIQAYPVGFLNAFIAIADIYYIVQMYKKSEYFKMQEVEASSKYLGYFLDYFKEDIYKYFPEFEFNAGENVTVYYLLRNVVPAGIVVAEHSDDDYLFVHLDYAAPEYRDLKLGQFFYRDKKDYFKNEKLNGFKAYAYNLEHEKYLSKMGFSFVRSDGDKKLFQLDI